MKLAEVYRRLLEGPQNINLVIQQALESAEFRLLTPVQINSGACEDFADYIIKQFPAAKEINDGLFWVDENSQSDKFFNKPNYIRGTGEYYDINIFKKYNSVPNTELIEKLGSRSFPGHVWIYYDDKHYDAEAPNGVESLFDLPIFKRAYK